MSTEQQLKTIIDGQIAHEKLDDTRFKAIEDHLKEMPKKEDMNQLVKEAMIAALSSTGKKTKLWITTIAIVMGSLVIISGGLKWLLGLFGFYVMKQ